MSIEIRCFHGTTLARAQSIIESGFFFGTHEGLWLGTGIYFFENGYQHALSWAERAAEKDDDKPAIIEAKLNVKKLVDLSDRGHWHSVRQVYDLMAEDDLLPLDQEGPEVLFTDDETYSSQTWKHLTDHAVMDWYLEGLNATLLANGEELDAVRCPFVGGRQIYENSWFFHRSCNMIAVKNGRSVVDLFIHQT